MRSLDEMNDSNPPLKEKSNCFLEKEGVKDETLDLK